MDVGRPYHQLVSPLDPDDVVLETLGVTPFPQPYSCDDWTGMDRVSGVWVPGAPFHRDESPLHDWSYTG